MSLDHILVLQPSALAIYKHQLNLVRLKCCLDRVPNCCRPLLSGTFSLPRNSKGTHSEHSSSLFTWWRFSQVPATQHFTVVMHQRKGNIAEWSWKSKAPFIFFFFFFCYLPDLDHQLGEVGSLSGVVGPAAGHERVEGRRAVVWFGQPDSLLQLVDHVSVLEPEKRLLPAAHYLPHAHGYRRNTDKRRSVEDEYKSVRLLPSGTSHVVFCWSWRFNNPPSVAMC